MKVSGVFDSRKDTLCSDLGQRLNLTRLAEQFLSDHKKQVCVFDPLCMEQSVGDSDRYLAGSIWTAQGCELINTAN